MYVLDTCALLWWTLDPDKLSEKAAVACDKIASKGGAVSSISLWEIGIKIKNSKLEIGMTIESYTDKVKQIPGLSIVPVDETIWLRNLALQWDHRDPADRTIVATAAILQWNLVTSDQIIARFFEKTLW